MEHQLLPFVTEFFTRLGIAYTGLTVDQTGDDIQVRIETSDSALLIGIHGKNLEGIQHLLSRMIERQIHLSVHVHLEVNDYVKLKDEKLFRFVDSKIQALISSGKPTKILNLSAYERKKVHHYIAEQHIPGLSTESQGEGADRYLLISYTGPLTQEIRPEHSHVDILSDDGIGI